MTSGRALPGRRIGVLLSALTGMQILASLALQLYLLTRLGAGVITDAFYAGATVSQVIAVIAIDTLAVVLVPLLASKSADELRDDAWSLCLAAMVGYTVIALMLSVVAPLVASAVVPGFGAEAKALTASLMRIHLLGHGRQRVHARPHLGLSDSAAVPVAAAHRARLVVGCPAARRGDPGHLGHRGGGLGPGPRLHAARRHHARGPRAPGPARAGAGICCAR